MSLTLYYAPNSSASPITWALAELGVPYEGVIVDLEAKQQKQAPLTDHNPMGQVPTLVDDGQGMFESSAILIHLGQKYGVERGLWPAADSPAHMVALSWTAWLCVTLLPTLRTVMINTSEHFPAEMRNEAQTTTFRARVNELMQLLDAQLAKHEYVVGERFTLVDLYAAALVGWACGVVHFDLSTTPTIAAWLPRCMGREATKQMK